MFYNYNEYGKEDTMIRNVLVATDGSPLAGKAVKFAVGLAKQMKANVTVAGVVDLTMLIAPATYTPAAANAAALMEAREIIEQATRGEIDRAAAIVAKAGIAVKKVIRTGRPAEEIIKAAKASKAGLIVLGSHGRSAIKAVLLGSVAYGVIHGSSSIPVTVVRR
jgi:nucleotide-binding universal stress UspA family protein